MEYIMKRPFHWSWNCLKVEKMDWPAPVDMYEKEDNFVMRAELPGMKKEDIDISVTGDMLSIKGDRRPPAEVKDNEYKCS